MKKVAVPAHVIDVLNSLLEAEGNSIFRFVQQASPYLGGARGDIRGLIDELGQMSHEHSSQLADLIDSLGGVVLARQAIRMEEQHLAFLSLKFLMPKLLMDKELIIRRYENAKRAIGPEFPEVIVALDGMIAQCRQKLQDLRAIAA